MEFNDVQIQASALSGEITATVAKLLSSGRYILGPEGEAFEQEFSRYCGAAYGVGVASGTDALSIGLRTAGVSPGDEVIVPAISAPATAMAVAAIGATPVFADVSSEDFNISPESVRARLTSKTKAIAPVHLYGMPARLDALASIAGPAIPIVEDAAQAHGSRGPWGPCGAFGIAAAFSFYPTKNLGGYGDGGMLVTSDPAVAERAKLLRNYGQRENYASEILGGNSRLDEIQAAILRIKLKQLDGWNAGRRRIAALYRDGLSNLPLRMQAETGETNGHLFVVVTPDRAALRRHLTEHEVPTLIHYPIPLPRQQAFAAFNPAPCPNADRITAEVLSLPMSPSLTETDARRVIETVRNFFR